jgi:UDP-glucose 4-epimerase
VPSSVALVEGDIRDPTKLDEAFRSARPDSVIHLAAMHFIPDCVARPADTLEVNVTGTRAVLDCCRRGAVEHVVFASSAAVYAPVEAACVEDITPLRPLEIYGESKLRGRSSCVSITLTRAGRRRFCGSSTRWAGARPIRT